MKSLSSRFFTAAIAGSVFCGGGLMAAPSGLYNKNCPVMTTEAIDENLGLEYEGKKVYFCCKQCQRIWQRQANYIIKARGPEALPQFKGMEAALGLDSITLLPQAFCPVEKGALITPGSPGSEYKGVKVYFLNTDAKADWDKDPDTFAAKAVADGVLPQLKGKVTAAAGTPVATTPAAGGTDNKLAAEVKEILSSRCAYCHGTPPVTPKKFQYVDDLAKLRVSRLVVIGKPEDSELYRQIQAGDMPLTTKAEKEAGKQAEPLTPAQVSLIGEWIRKGAPVDAEASPAVAQATPPPEVKPAADATAATAQRKIVSLSGLAAGALADLNSIEPREDRKDVRYVSLEALHNNTVAVSDTTLSDARIGVRKLLNSLSTNPKVALFEETGPEKILFRVRLRDLGWTARTWDTIAACYPYGIEGNGLEAVGAACGSAIPIIRADWLAACATRPPLYHTILAIPATVSELEKELKIDINQNLRDGRAVRSGFSKSGISLANRLAEHHELGSHQGSFWISYDFQKSSGTGRLTDFPLGPKSARLAGGGHAFEHAGGEIIWTLPNGFFAYMLTDARGHRLDGAAPANIVGDRDNVTGRVEISNGLSCITCHSQGLKVMPPDEVRGSVNAGKLSADEQRLVELLHPPQEKIDTLVRDGQAAFQSALKAANVADTKGEPVYLLAKHYEENVTLAQAAAEFGLSAEEFKKKLDEKITVFFDLAQLLPRGNVIRESFEEKFPEVVKRLDFGTVRTVATPGVVSSLVSSALSERGGPLAVKLTTDRTSYKDGDKLIATVRASQDCHLYLFYKNAAGEIIYLFPNKFHPDSAIKGGLAVEVPSASDDFDIVIEGPAFGTEQVAAIVSSTRFANEKDLEAALKKDAVASSVDHDIEAALTKSARVAGRKARLGFSRVTIHTSKN